MTTSPGLMNNPQRHLFGREVQQEQLLQLVKTSTSSNIALVRGVSGSGKSTLCESWLPSQLDASFLMGVGKFDQRNQNESVSSLPYAAIIQAMEGLHAQASPEIIQECLQGEASLLKNMIPAFRDDEDFNQASSSTTATNNNKMNLALERFAIALKTFLKRLSQKQPVVLFLDDLQFSDKASLQLLQAVLINHDNNIHEGHFVFLGGYRSDQVTTNLQQFMDGSQVHTKVHHVVLHNLSTMQLNDLVSAMLQQDSNQTHNLTQWVHRRTNGNPYFSLQYLQQLQHLKLLTYDWARNQWFYDIEKVKQYGPGASDSMMQVVTQRIQSCPSLTRHALMLAACLGFQCDEDILRQLVQTIQQDSDDADERVQDNDGATKARVQECATCTYEEAIQKAVDEGFVDIFTQGKTSMVRFTHDKVQESVYELIPNPKSLHAQIGDLLLPRLSECDTGSSIFYVSDQYYRGEQGGLSDQERRARIRIHSQASREAEKRSALEWSLEFLRHATALLQPQDWTSKETRSFVMDLYNRSAETAASRGNYQESEHYISEILKQSTHPNETIRARIASCNALGFQGYPKEAIKESRRILKVLGVKMPPANPIFVMRELFRARKMMKNRSHRDILALASMKDDQMLTAMQILKLGTVLGFADDKNYAALCYMTMVRLTLMHGLSYMAPFVFSGYAFMIAIVLGKEEDAFGLMDLIQKLSETYGEDPSQVLMVYCFVYHLKRPAVLTHDHFLRGYRIGLETGDIGYGAICVAMYGDAYRLSGLPLDNFAQDMTAFVGQLALCNQDFIVIMMLPYIQLGLNLTGHSDHPKEISFEQIYLDFKEIAGRAPKKIAAPAELSRLYAQIQNSMVFGDTELIKESLDKIFRLPDPKFDGPHLCNTFFVCWDGLAAAHVCRHPDGFGTRKYKRILRKSIRWLSRASSKGNVNAVDLLLLLEAEYASLNTSKSPHDVLSMYDKAIVSLARSGYLNYGALANENASVLARNRLGDEELAQDYLKRSLQFYEEYGCVVKVKEMVKNNSCLQSISGEASYTTHRGRARYNSMLDKVSGSGGSQLRVFTELQAA